MLHNWKKEVPDLLDIRTSEGLGYRSVTKSLGRKGLTGRMFIYSLFLLVLTWVQKQTSRWPTGVKVFWSPVVTKSLDVA